MAIMPITTPDRGQWVVYPHHRQRVGNIGAEGHRHDDAEKSD